MSEQTAVVASSAPPTAMERKVLEVLPLVGGDRRRAEKVVRVAANAVSKTPLLARCDKGKLWLAIQEVVSLGLPFGGRGAYLVPYKDDVTVIVSPHGLIELMFRHPLVKSVQARVVREGEHFRVFYAPEQHIEHAPLVTGAPGALVGCYAIIELTNGGRVIEYMSRDEVQKIKNVSQSARSGRGPWKDWEEEMWRKTVLKRAGKYVPQSEELMKAFDLDDADTDLDTPHVAPDGGSGAEAPQPTGTGVAALKAALAARRASPADLVVEEAVGHDEVPAQFAEVAEADDPWGDA
jgi:recombination protein RecT